MKQNLFRNTTLALLGALMLLQGCVTEQQQSSRRYLWPRPPDPPKIEWLKSYYGENDFPKTGFAEFIEIVFGRTEPTLFEKPIDIKSNGKGIVYVTDIVLGAIFVFDLNNQKVEVWRRGSDPDNSLALLPYYIALDSNGNLYTVGTGSNNVYVTDSKGTVLRKFDYSEKVKSPGGIFVDSDSKRIYLVDIGNNKVSVFDLAGKFLFSFGKGGDGDGEFNRPLPITMNNKGEIIIGDTMNSRVQIFDKEGKFLRKFGERGDTGPAFQIIKGVATDSDDNVYVTDGKANSVKIFNTNGDFLMTLGGAYSVTKTMREAPGGFLLPQGIFIDKNDTIYIADQANVRFQIFKYLKDGLKKDDASAPKELK